eukprot:TRINITY_DN6407_c0_g1_i1.p3 TRINITY_DN6407_c0_g1~~TRINITY_DN6407_c0_g1_i1.p3  ORF type:complete len:142 (+),score=14.54 TRINITY_DN6407_c0_g1_i1:157-582(+)
MSKATIILAAGHNLVVPPITASSYASIEVAGQFLAKTKMVANSIAPEWNLSCPVDPRVVGVLDRCNLRITVVDEVSNSILGSYTKITDFTIKSDGWYPLEGSATAMIRFAIFPGKNLPEPEPTPAAPVIAFPPTYYALAIK